MCSSDLEIATERLMETGVKPAWLVQAALAMTLAAAFCFTRGWHWAALALLALGWFEMRHGAGWGAMLAALAATSFAEAGRIEKAGKEIPGGQWHFTRRNAIWLAAPLAVGGWWNLYLALLATYAATSFFIIQHFRHSVEPANSP